MDNPREMTTLSEVMNNQRAKGFTEDFNFDVDKFVTKDKQYKPEDLTIVQTFRFEGPSDPSYMEILYSIEANDGTKGLLVDAFGAYSAQDAQKMAGTIKRMKILENHSKN